MADFEIKGTGRITLTQKDLRGPRPPWDLPPPVKRTKRSRRRHSARVRGAYARWTHNARGGDALLCRIEDRAVVRLMIDQITAAALAPRLRKGRP